LEPPELDKTGDHIIYDNVDACAILETARELGLDLIEDPFPVEEEEETPSTDPEKPPAYVQPVPQLCRDITAMQTLLCSETPLQVILHPVWGACSVVYGGGDASGEGFGSITFAQGLPPLMWKGFWCMEVSERSSNF